MTVLCDRIRILGHVAMMYGRHNKIRFTANSELYSTKHVPKHPHMRMPDYITTDLRNQIPRNYSNRQSETFCLTVSTPRSKLDDLLVEALLLGELDWGETLET